MPLLQLHGSYYLFLLIIHNFIQFLKNTFHYGKIITYVFDISKMKNVTAHTEAVILLLLYR